MPNKKRQPRKHSNTVIHSPKTQTHHPKKVTPACYRALGARIEQVRLVMGLTQAELATKVGMARSAVANVEAGRQAMLLHQLENFSRGLGVTPKSLLKGIWF